MNTIRIASFSLLLTAFYALPGQAGVEPTVLDERHYTSGRSERHQRISPTLPEGAPIPDSPAFTSSIQSGTSSAEGNPIGSTPSTTDTARGGTPTTSTGDSSPAKAAGLLKLPEEFGRVEGPKDTNICQVEPTVLPESYATPIGDKRKLAGKIDQTLEMRLEAESRNENARFRLKLEVSSCSPPVIRQLKEIRHLRIVTVSEKENEIVIEAAPGLVSKIVEIPEVRFITRPH